MFFLFPHPVSPYPRLLEATLNQYPPLGQIQRKFSPSSHFLFILSSTADDFFSSGTIFHPPPILHPHTRISPQTLCVCLHAASPQLRRALSNGSCIYVSGPYFPEPTALTSKYLRNYSLLRLTLLLNPLISVSDTTKVPCSVISRTRYIIKVCCVFSFWFGLVLGVGQYKGLNPGILYD